MLRIIRIGDQINEGDNSFAWFDTVPNRFLDFGGDQVFESWLEFEEACKRCHPDWDIERFRNLFHD